jgi:hypothetical protein
MTVANAGWQAPRSFVFPLYLARRADSRGIRHIHIL